MRLRLPLILMLLVMIPLPAAAGKNTSYPLVRQLMEEGDWFGSLSEINRLIVEHPGKKKELVYYRAVSLTLGGEHAKAYLDLTGLSSTRSILLAGYALQGMGRPADSLFALDSLAYGGERETSRALLGLRVEGLVAMNRTEEALVEVERARHYLEPGRAGDLESVLIDYDRLPLVSPTWSVVSSALVPGLGQVVSGRWGEGIATFLALAGLATGGVAAWKTGHYNLMWAAAATGIVLYGANLYGAWSAARRRNHELREEGRRRVREYLPAYRPAGEVP